MKELEDDYMKPSKCHTSKTLTFSIARIMEPDKRPKSMKCPYFVQKSADIPFMADQWQYPIVFYYPSNFNVFDFDPTKQTYDEATYERKENMDQFSIGLSLKQAKSTIALTEKANRKLCHEQTFIKPKIYKLSLIHISEPTRPY